jgi:cell division protein FtsN
MKGNDSESSLVIVSRRVLIAGIAGISIFSFGLGYFLGYGGTPANRLVKQVEADNKITPSEERTVLDSSGKPTMVPPPAMPGAVPKEPPLKPRPEEMAKDGAKEGTKTVQNVPETAEKQKKPAETASGKEDEKALKNDAVLSRDKGQSPAASENRNGKKAGSKISAKPKEKQLPAVVKKKKPASKSDGTSDKKSYRRKSTASKKPTATPVKARTPKTYELQVGAFEDPAKAESLRKDLSEKGYKASVATFSPRTGVTFSRVRLGPYKDKKEAEETHSALKTQGMEAIVIYGVK